jgi:uncharacterized membrane protein
MANTSAMTMVAVSATNRAAVASVMMVLHELRRASALQKLERRRYGRSLRGGQRNAEGKGRSCDGCD